MWFCKLQSVLHVQHENKVLNPGLIVQRIATDLEICLYGLHNHRVGRKSGVSWYYHVTLNKKLQHKPLLRWQFGLVYVDKPDARKPSRLQFIKNFT